MKIKNVLSSCLFITILIGLISLSSHIFEPKDNVKVKHIEDYQSSGVFAEKKNTIDAVLFGDSETYSSISPMEMWKRYGITSYVCGTSGQLLVETENFMNMVLKTQKPKVIMLETNNFYRRFGLETYVNNKVDILFPIFRYHDRWKVLNHKEIGKEIDYTNIDHLKGYRYVTKMTSSSKSTNMKPTKKILRISDQNIRIIKRITKTCKENNISLILLSTPSTKNWNTKKHNAVEELAKELDVHYIDMNLMNDTIKINWLKDTRDRGDHLNHRGAIKASRCMGDILSKEYKLKDHREDKAYDDWKKSLKIYNQKTKGN